ncbi:hypothetical protein WJ969_26975 [Achromobacter xylosoxidans]
MLLAVLSALLRIATIGTQELARIVRVCGDIADGVEFMVTHDAQSLAVIHHGADDFQDTALPRASIHQITKEYRLMALGAL